MFGMISMAVTLLLDKQHGKINATVYKEILKKHIVPNLRTANNQLAVFIQYNALCHTVRSVKIFPSAERPAQSPGMSPIENVWKELNERVKENNLRNFEEL